MTDVCEEEGRLTVGFWEDDDTKEPTGIADLTEIITNTEQQKNCKCFVCYSSKQTENIEVEDELLKDLFIDVENTDNLEKMICEKLAI